MVCGIRNYPTIPHDVQFSTGTSACRPDQQRFDQKPVLPEFPCLPGFAIAHADNSGILGGIYGEQVP